LNKLNGDDDDDDDDDEKCGDGTKILKKQGNLQTG